MITLPRAGIAPLVVDPTTGAISGFTAGASRIVFSGGGALGGTSGSVDINASGSNQGTTMTVSGSGVNVSAGPFRINGASSLIFGATANATINVSTDATNASLKYASPSAGFHAWLVGATAYNTLSSTAMAMAPGVTYSWTSGDPMATAVDTSISRSSAGVVGIPFGALIGGAGNFTFTAGTGNSRTMTLRTTTSGGTATNFLVADATQGVTLGSLAGTGSRAVMADANGLLSAPVSDELWKEPLRALPQSYGIATVMKLRPAIFKYKDHSRFGAQDYIGFGARATAAVLPEVTGQDRDGTYYLTDEKLTAVLVLGMQQQQEEIQQLKARLAA